MARLRESRSSIGGNAAVCVALDDDGALCKGLAVLCESRVQERLSPLGQLLSVRPVLEQLRAGQPDSPVRAIGEGPIPAILFRGDVRQAVIAPLVEEAAQEEIVLRRFRHVGEIGGRRIDIGERCSDVRASAHAGRIGFGDVGRDLMEVLRAVT